MAEPESAPEKPKKLVAVSPEPAKREQKPPAGNAEQGRKAPAAGKASPAASGAAAKQDAPKRADKGTRWGVWLLVLLFLVVGTSALVQTERLGRAEEQVTILSEEIVAMEAQLAAANLQISSYEAQAEQVREAVGDLSQRILMLSELVGPPESAGPPPDEPAPFATPEP